MQSLSDLIQQYINNLLGQNSHGIAEFTRKELAEKFQCAPSQINYVLETRFSGDHGFIIESRRGGGGFIRIIRLEKSGEPDLQKLFASELTKPISARRAAVILERLVESGLISRRELVLIDQVLQEETEPLSPPFGEVLRSLILRSILFVLLNSRG